MEEALAKYVCEQRSRGLAVSVNDIREWSRKYMRRHDPHTRWQGSNRWSQRFRKRWGFTLRCRTKVGQKLSPECAADCEGFWKFVRINRARHQMDLRRIINADQTPLFVEMPAGRTLEQKGSRSVPVKTAGYEKQRLTVMLACTASGDKLRPWVWFKRKTIPECECPSGVEVQAQENDWMDEAAVKNWLEKEVLPFLNPKRGVPARRAMLVLDSYRGHLTDGMKHAYRTHCIIPAIIPAGCTPLIQPLDVSINRCFKAGVRDAMQSGLQSTASTYARPKETCAAHPTPWY
ncbi:hypothetical protein CLOM_g11899 [Closterium sp. NIES-68]|nr:hypothetical protein CLOM_g11899 [Closterium sp. NIES-68]GJP72275.1 hypothetical protein CLOP_g3024 [Closterium sp. NIES-67]